MGTDHETEAKLLASAKSEFLEKGYAKASLRKICANAGMTTGALYFFFKDKEDLFRSIVEKPFRELLEMMKIHFAEDAQLFSESAGYVHAAGDHEELVQLLIHHLYKNREAFLLLLTKSQGSRFENCLDEVVDISEQQYRRLCDMVTNATGRPRVDDYMTHWMAHIMVDTFVHLFLHETEERVALKHVDALTMYLVRGWMGIMTES